MSIVEVLEERYGSIPSSNFLDILDSFESVILVEAIAHAMAYLSDQCPSVKLPSHGEYFILDTISYQLLHADNILKPELLFAIMPSSNKPPRTITLTEHTSNVNSFTCGRYSRIVLRSPRLPSIDLDALAAQFAATYSSAYSWFRHFLKRNFLALEKEYEVLARDLYAYIKSLISPHCSDEAANAFLLGVNFGGKGFYIMDYDTIEGAMDKVSNTSPGHVSLPKLVMELLGTSMPFRDCFAYTAIAERRCITIDLADAKYLEHHPEYELAEELLYGTKELCIYPVEWEGNENLQVVFSIDHREELVHLLDKYRMHIAQYFRSRKGLLGRSVLQLRAYWRNRSVAKLGEFIGGLIRGWTER